MFPATVYCFQGFSDNILISLICQVTRANFTISSPIIQKPE
jgi:hypothetical protein